MQTEEDYSIDEEELEEDEPEEELEEEEQNKEHMPETRISVLLTQKGKYYEFMFVRREYEILEPLEILRHVLLLVDIISKTPVEHLVQYLHTFAIDALIPHEIAEKEFKSAALKLLKMKMTLIKAAIESNNALKN